MADSPFQLTLTAEDRPGRFTVANGSISYPIEFRPETDVVLGDLLRRLRPVLVGGSDPSGSNPVDGVWRSVSFADHSPRELRIGDCELVEQFRNMLLPMFTTRNVEDHTTCVPHQESGSVISLRFESFTAAPRTPHTRPVQPST